MMKLFMAIIASLSLIIGLIFCLVWSYQFDKNCGDYLKLAGDAPTINKADEFLARAVDYLDRNGLNSGNSALIFKKPKHDVGIWYEQIKGAKETTAKILQREAEVPASVSQLEKDNALMKIREVVLDTGESGTKVTLPTHVSWYPNQWPIAIWLWLSAILAIIFWCLTE